MHVVVLIQIVFLWKTTRTNIASVGGQKHTEPYHYLNATSRYFQFQPKIPYRIPVKLHASHFPYHGKTQEKACSKQILSPANNL